LGRNYHLPIEHHVLAQRRWNASYGVWCAAPEHDQFLFLCRHLVRRNLLRVNSFLPEFKKVQDFHAEYSKNLNLIPAIVPCVRDALLASQITAETISELEKQIEPQLKYFRLRAQFLPKLLNFIFLTWRAVMRRIGFCATGGSVITSGGVMVAFTGIDGSGKSSALARFKKRFSNRIGVVTITMGSGQSGAGVLRQIVFYLVGSKAKFSGHVSLRQESRNVDKPKRFPWYYQLWLIVCLWEKRSELRRGLNGVRQGKIVLVDRWLQSQCKNGIDAPRTLNMINDTWLSTYLFNLEADIFRVSNALRPNLLLILDVSAKNSTIRKPDDLSLEKAREAREKLLSVQWNALKITSIDANMPIDLVDICVVSSINKAILGI
jgi:thymidylate kinase